MRRLVLPERSNKVLPEGRDVREIPRGKERAHGACLRLHFILGDGKPLDSFEQA